MTLFELILFAALAVQFGVVRVLTSKPWFSQLAPFSAALGQGGIVLVVTALVGGFVTSGLWFLVIGFPTLLEWVPGIAATGGEASIDALQRLQWVRALLVVSPYLYMAIRLYGHVRRRKADAGLAGGKQ